MLDLFADRNQLIIYHLMFGTGWDAPCIGCTQWADDLSDGHKVQTGSQTVEFDRGENHGVSVFTRDAAGQVFHTYSSYNRGIEALNGSMGYLDLLPQGRTW